MFEGNKAPQRGQAARRGHHPPARHLHPRHGAGRTCSGSSSSIAARAASRPTVTPKIVELPQKRVDLIFEIDEGPKTGIAADQLPRQQGLLRQRPARRDRDQADRAGTSSSPSNDNYDPDRLEYDREQLRKYYTQPRLLRFPRRLVGRRADAGPERLRHHLHGRRGPAVPLRQARRSRPRLQRLERRRPASRCCRSGRASSTQSDKIETGDRRPDLRRRRRRLRLRRHPPALHAQPRDQHRRRHLRGARRPARLRRAHRHRRQHPHPRPRHPPRADAGRGRRLQPRPGRPLAQPDPRAWASSRTSTIERDPGLARRTAPCCRCTVEEQPTGELSFGAGYSARSTSCCSTWASPSATSAAAARTCARASRSARCASRSTSRFTEPHFLGRDLRGRLRPLPLHATTSATTPASRPARIGGGAAPRLPAERLTPTAGRATPCTPTRSWSTPAPATCRPDLGRRSATSAARA